MKKRINNSENMKLIRKAMVDLNLDNFEELADFLYISVTALRDRVNGRRIVSKCDLEYMEHKLNIKFDWTDIIHVKGNFYRFFDRASIEKEVNN